MIAVDTNILAGSIQTSRAEMAGETVNSESKSNRPAYPCEKQCIKTH